MAVPACIGAVVVLQVSLPQRLTLEVVRRQIAIAKMGHDDLSIGHRRGAGGTIQLVSLQRLPLWPLALCGASADLPRPDDTSFALVDAQQQQLVVRRMRGDEDRVAP